MEASPSPLRRWHVASWALAAVTVAAAVVAVYGGVQVLDYNGQRGKPAGTVAQESLQSGYSSASTWANVWWPVAIGGALAGGGAVLAW